MKKFWDRVEVVFKKLFGSTSWEKTASAVVSYAAPLVETIVSLASGSAAAQAVSNVVATVQSDLATVGAVVSGATSTPAANELQVVKNALTSIQTNLSGLLAVAEVKNSTHASAISSAVNMIIGEVEAILSNMPTISPSPAAAKS